MSPYVLELLNLLLRVAHVIAAVMWIGDSFLFMFMDSKLSAPSKPREGDVVGELWMTHSGGFYEVVKRKSLQASELPAQLFWFKWESYTTWITGFFLLTVVFYLGGPAMLVDAGSKLSHVAAVHISLGLLFLGALVYHLLCATPLVSNNKVFGLVGLALVSATAWGLSHLFTPRAVFLQVGAMLATIMSSNVMLRIIPAQKHMLAATKAGQPVDTSYGARAKQRSVHNHYLTLPVLFTMVSNHLPAVYAPARGHAWLVLALVSVFAVGVKYVMNFGRGTHPAILAGTLAALAGAVGLTAPGHAAPVDVAAHAGHPKVGFATVQKIIETRCTACHAKQPARDRDFAAAAGGVALETPEQVKAQALRIYARAVATRTMPQGNLTGMRDDERELLGAWVAQGADVTAQDESPGRALFAARCVTCHGPEGRGDGELGAQLTPRPRDLGDAAWQAATTDEAIRKIIHEGGGAVGKSPLMPAQADLQPDALDALVKHIRGMKR